ncbi:hypothetical protein K438DRAFT_1982375 [Mycena galopus ATCC 62051]|nr:hypothetical protein K438DRAFT_1982375 [Mycena galopus ATCC 62051]
MNLSTLHAAASITNSRISPAYLGQEYCEIELQDQIAESFHRGDAVNSIRRQQVRPTSHRTGRTLHLSTRLSRGTPVACPTLPVVSHGPPFDTRSALVRSRGDDSHRRTRQPPPVTGPVHSMLPSRVNFLPMPASMSLPRSTRPGLIHYVPAPPGSGRSVDLMHSSCGGLDAHDSSGGLGHSHRYSTAIFVSSTPAASLPFPALRHPIPHPLAHTSHNGPPLVPALFVLGRRVRKKLKERENK